MSYIDKIEVLFDVPNYEGLYSVTHEGKIFSWGKKIYLKPQKQRNGYLTVNLAKDKKMKTFTIHRIVASVFCLNPLNKKIVNHKNLIKQDNHFENLEWVTNQENIQHAVANGRGIGENNGRSKLKESDILEIRSKYKFRKYTYEQLGNEYGVMKHYVGRIISKKVWKHI